MKDSMRALQLFLEGTNIREITVAVEDYETVYNRLKDLCKEVVDFREILCLKFDKLSFKELDDRLRGFYYRYITEDYEGETVAIEDVEWEK